jgi:uncharacterized protein YggT (Ycf19 family)
VIYVVKQVVLLFVSGLQLAMLGRAILSWIPLDEDNPVETFLYGVTEPVIYPIRVLFYKLNWFVGFPFDMAFMAAILLLGLLGIVLR